MVKVFMAGWSGKSVTQGKIIEVNVHPRKGQTTVDALREFFTVKEHHASKYSAYGTAGAMWYINGGASYLVGTWYRDTYGNAYFRDTVDYKW